MSPYELTAHEALVQMRNRALSCEELVRSCLAHIEARDGDVRAWIAIDADAAIRQSRERDKCDAAASLHGLPWGVKDIIETADFATTYNSPLYLDHRTFSDAACVRVVRRCGGIIIGKCDTVEFACGGRKALTRNPHNLAHTPGGSSSGSAAAVAARMVPLAFGTQSAGSHIRPAAFTGIYALKPTYGLVNRDGVRNYAPTLDTVGWFARSVQDLALVAAAFRFPGIASGNARDVRRLRIAVCRTPMWNRAEPAGKSALLAAAERLSAAGARVEEVELPRDFDRLPAAQHTILHGEGRASFVPDFLHWGNALHEDFVAEAENALGITPEALRDAYDLAGRCRPTFDAMLDTGFDGLLTLAAAGEALHGLESTGDPIFNSLWTLLHVPCVAIPAGRGPQGLPVGLQLIGSRFSDLRLLGVAAAIAAVIDVPSRD